MQKIKTLKFRRRLQSQNDLILFFSNLKKTDGEFGSPSYAADSTGPEVSISKLMRKEQSCFVFCGEERKFGIRTPFVFF